MLKNGMRPVRPGEVLREDYLKPLGLSVNAASQAPERTHLTHERRSS